MILVERLRKARDDPRAIAAFTKRKIAEITRLTEQRRPGALASYVVTGITGYSPYDYYLRYLQWRTTGSPVRSINGSEMALSLTDAGISRELFLYRTREGTTVKRFEHELRRLRTEVSGPVRVLEIGANIGYFALSEARVLGERAEIHAFEPDSRNLPLLYENISRNGYGDRISVTQAAVGPAVGRATLRRSAHSNRNLLAPDGGSETVHRHTEALSLTGETRVVDVWSVDAYCREHDVAPDGINVVRMDVEGYETDILRGMASVLRAEGPLLLFVEIHPHLLSESEYRWFITTLDDHGFDLLDAISEGITARPFDGSLGVDHLLDLLDVEQNGYKILAKRPAERYRGSRRQPGGFS